MVFWVFLRCSEAHSKAQKYMSFVCKLLGSRGLMSRGDRIFGTWALLLPRSRHLWYIDTFSRSVYKFLVSYFDACSYTSLCQLEQWFIQCKKHKKHLAQESMLDVQASCVSRLVHVSWAWVGYKTNPNVHVCYSGKIACQTETKCAWACICLFVTRDLFHIASRRISYPLFCFLLVSGHSRWPSAVTFYVHVWVPLSCQ